MYIKIIKKQFYYGEIIKMVLLKIKITALRMRFFSFCLYFSLIIFMPLWCMDSNYLTEEVCQQEQLLISQIIETKNLITQVEQSAKGIEEYADGSYGIRAKGNVKIVNDHLEEIRKISQELIDCIRCLLVEANIMHINARWAHAAATYYYNTIVLQKNPSLKPAVENTYVILELKKCMYQSILNEKTTNQQIEQIVISMKNILHKAIETTQAARPYLTGLVYGLNAKCFAEKAQTYIPKIMDNESAIRCYLENIKKHAEIINYFAQQAHQEANKSIGHINLAALSINT